MHYLRQLKATELIGSVCPVLLVLLAGACGFPRPPDVLPETRDDAQVNDAPAPELPGTVVQVSSSGNDANDGLTQPVRTLKRALGLAAADSEIKTISLSEGRYTAASGETFPYTLPPDLTVRGPAGGGALLAGSDAEPGMMANAGRLQNLELEAFTVAIVATGKTSLANVRVRTNTLGIRAESSAQLSIDNLEIAGVASGCASGIELNGAASLLATTLATRNLGVSIDAKAQSSLMVRNANISGATTCDASAFSLRNNGAVTISNSIFDGGYIAVQIQPTTGMTSAVATNVVFRNMRHRALYGSSAMLTMVGGEMTDVPDFAAELFAGTWRFENVAFNQTVAGSGIYLQGAGTGSVGNLVMRGCTVRARQLGVYLFDWATANLGTNAQLGGNTLLSSEAVALQVDGNLGGKQIDAVGNTWRSNRQGADANGRYLVHADPVSGPVAVTAANNYAITSSTFTLQVTP